MQAMQWSGEEGNLVKIENCIWRSFYILRIVSLRWVRILCGTRLIINSHLKMKTKFQGGSIEGFFISFFLTWEDCHTWKQPSPRVWRRVTESTKLLWKAWGTRDPIGYVCVAILEIGISLQSRIYSSPEETNMKSWRHISWIPFRGTKLRWASEAHVVLQWLKWI